MGAYSDVAGWISVPEQLLGQAAKIVASFDDEASESLRSRETLDWYLSGWHVQASGINGFCCAFYGGRIRTYCVPLIQRQVEQLAKLDFVNTEFDYTLKPDGRFLVVEDGSYDLPDCEWIIEWGTFTRHECRRT